MSSKTSIVNEFYPMIWKQRPHRLAGGVGFSASAVAGDGKVYFTSEEGDVYVVKAGKGLENLATNSLGEICMATPAIARGTLLFRTRGHVVAIGPGARSGDKGGHK